MVPVQCWTGRETRALRQALRMTVQGFADHLGVARRTVSKWEARGTGIEPVPELQAVLDTALKRADDDARLRFATGAPIQSGDDDVRRREILQLLPAAAGLLAATELAELADPAEPVRRRIEGVLAAEPGARDVDDWARVVAGYGARMGIAAPGRMAQHLLLDLGDVSQQLARFPAGSSSPARRGLARVAGQLAVTLAVTVVASGATASAARWWRTARHLAEESGDGELVAFVLGQQAIMAPYSGYDAGYAVGLAEQAIARFGETICPGTASAIAANAQGLSLLGREREAVAALRRLHGTVDALPAGTGRGDPSWFSFSEVKVAHVESYVHTALGHARAASTAQAAALVLYPAGSYRGPSQIELHRATVQVRTGAVTDGLAHAVRVLKALPADRSDDHLVHFLAARTLAVVPAERRAGDDHDELRHLVRVPR